MLVEAQVSSINTSLSRSIPGCASLQARRAACTSSRSCSLACRVFFEGEIPLVQLVPQVADLDRNALRCQPLLQLGQGQTRLRCDPGAQRRLRLLQTRPAMAADRKTGTHPSLLLPVPHLIDIEAADLVAPRNRRWTFSSIQCTKHPLAQILRIRLHPHLPSTNKRIITWNVDT